MAGLLGSLSAAARAMNAQAMGLQVVGENIANVNTPGYARRVVDLAAVPPESRWSAGNGVEVAGIRSIRDMLVEVRLLQEVSAHGEQAALADGLGAIDAMLGRPGESIDGALTAFFDAFSELADNPTSASARQGVLAQGASLADGFHDLSSRLADARFDADSRLAEAVGRVNTLAGEIASLNASIGIAGDRDSTTLMELRDRQMQALQELSELVQVHTIAREDGGFEVTLGNGRPLVAGVHAVPLAVSRNADGTIAFLSQDVDVTQEVTGGRLGGLRQLRDKLIPGYQSRLDTLASGVVTQVNLLHEAGFDLDGNEARPFFTPLSGTAGAATSIEVNPELTANARLVAAATTAEAGDNGAARAIAALRGARVLDDGTATFAEGFGNFAYRVGADRALAMQREAGCAEAVRQVRNLRESVSGVSIDEEAALMMKFQRAYQANARYFQSVDAAIQTLLQLVGA
jgi:flagellar hook-associated protein 1 FlgK